jgi:hypothetical protein
MPSMSSTPMRGSAKRGNGHANGRAAAPASLRFVLYVEGPRDQSLLEAWAQRVSPALAETLSDATVILGGRQPARAAEHFRELREQDAEARGLCVLDRDADGAPQPRTVEEPGLEFYTWGRRHIESYLLVPAAIRRSLRLAADDARVDRFFARQLPRDEAGLGAVDAKPLFAFQGELQRLLGRAVRPAQVARAMYAGEIHPDVRSLFARVRAVAGLDA